MAQTALLSNTRQFTHLGVQYANPALPSHPPLGAELADIAAVSDGILGSEPDPRPTSSCQAASCLPQWANCTARVAFIICMLWVSRAYNRFMNVTTKPARHVGVRELKTNLSRYVAEVRDGAEVVVTDHGHPVARLVPIQGQTAMERLTALISRGEVTPRQTRGPRTVPRPIRLPGDATVSDLVPDQRQ